MSNAPEIYTFKTKIGNVVLPLIHKKPSLVRSFMAINSLENPSMGVQQRVVAELLDTISVCIMNGTEGKRAFDSIDEDDIAGFLEEWGQVSQMGLKKGDVKGAVNKRA